LVKLAREKPRYGYRRLHAVLERRGEAVNVKRVRRRKRKRLLRERAAAPRLARANEEWAMDFIVDGLANGRMVRILSVVDAFTRECLALEADTSLGRGRVTRVLGRLIEERGQPESACSDNGPEFTSRWMLGWAEERKISLVHIQPGCPLPHAERLCGEFPRPAARRLPECKLVPYNEQCAPEGRSMAPGVQLQSPAQLAGLQDTTEVRGIWSDVTLTL
jgi:putative transposase